MVKVTPHDNLVPDTRDRCVNGLPYTDLTFNYNLARRLIRVASHVFHVKKGSAIFSGYVADGLEGSFTVKIWHQGQFFRSVELGGLGYQGVLHLDIQGELDEAIGWDPIAYLSMGPNASRSNLDVSCKITKLR